MKNANAIAMSVAINDKYITKRNNLAIGITVIYGELKLNYWTAYLNANNQVTEVQPYKVQASWKMTDEIKAIVNEELAKLDISKIPVKVWNTKKTSTNTADADAADALLDNRASI